MKACPQCKELFSDTDEFCPHHGSKLLGVAPVSVGNAAMAIPQPIIARQKDAMIGQSLDGRYTLEQKLGEGGMGVVYRATHTVIEKTVAVKVLRRDVARDSSVVQRFLQEAKAASRIGHANIVDVTDFGTLPDGSAYFVMEYIDGMTLSKAFREAGKAFPLSRALPIVAQLARALGAAHDKGVVHRDLKPENIFLTEREGRHDFVKIVDFGIAKMSTLEGHSQGPRLTRVGSVFGTPEYMAPEQAAGRSDTDQRVDIYALGTMLYEMLVGRVPHSGDTLVATIAMQMLDPIVPPRVARPDVDISDEIEQVIMRALEKDRDARYASMAEFLAALEHAAGGIPLDPMSSTGSSRVLKAVTQHPTLRGASSTPAPGAVGAVPTAAADAPTLMPVVTPAPKIVVRPAATIVNEPPAPSETAEHAAGRGRAASRRYLIAAAVIAVLALAGVGIAFMARGGDEQTAQAPVVIGGGTADAGAAAVPAAADAAVVAVLAPADAAVPVRTPPVRPDAGAVVKVPKPPQPPAAKVRIKVTTEPEGAELFTGPDRAGPDGTTFERPKGTKLTIRCTNATHEPGTVTVVFDEKTDHVTCKLVKKKGKCVEGLKNPLDDCP